MFVDRYYRREHPVLCACFGFIAGLIFRNDWPVWWPAVACLFAGGLLCAVWKRKKITAVGLLSLFFLLGSYQLQACHPPDMTCFLGKDITVHGSVQESQRGQSYFWMTLKSSQKSVLVQVVLPRQYDADGRLDDSLLWYPAGSKVMVEGTFRLPQGQRNPGGFDEAWWLRGKNAALILEAQTIQMEKAPTGIWKLAADIRCWMEQTIEQTLTAEEAGAALALLLGDKGGLSADFYRLTQRMGMAHIFAISGLHVGFMGTMLLFMFRVCGLERSWLAFFVLLISLSFYCLLAGLPPSAVRAATMILLAALGVCLLRPVYSLDFLAAAALVLLWNQPFLLWTAGFQLSFGVTVALLLFAQPLRKKLAWISNAMLRNGLSVAIAAYLGSLPLSAWHFYTVSLLAPLFNLLFVPVVSVLVPCLFLACLVASFFPAAADLLFLPASLLLQILLQGTMKLSELLGSGHLYIGRPSMIALLLYGCLLALIWYFLNKKEKKDEKEWDKRQTLGAIAMLSAVIVWLCLPVPPKTDQLLYLDTGQGSCAVYRTTADETIILDGGLQQRELASCLAWYGINQVDAIVLSHSDADHISGIPQVLENLQVKRIFLEKQQLERKGAAELCRLAKENQTEVCAVETALTIPLQHSSLQLQVYEDAKQNTNSRELTAVIKSSVYTAAFPGDLALSGILKFAEDLQTITIWTVPHHGSRSSSSADLYEKLRRKGVEKAVISAGAENRYGHPHSEVLKQLAAQQIAVYRTDLQGAICLQLEV